MVATKSTKATKWFVRVDGETEFLRQKCREFAQRLDVVSFISQTHVGERKENPHVHICLETTKELQKQSFALQLKEHFKIEKKTQYALDVWDGNRVAYGACSYLFHEETEALPIYKGWTNAEISEVQRIAKEANVVIEKNKQKAETKLVEKALNHFKDLDIPSEYEIFGYMMRQVSEGQSYWPGSFRVKQFVEEVYIKLNKGKETFLTDYFYNKIWRS